MYGRYAAILFLLSFSFLLPFSAVMSAADQARTPAPGDPGYVAEDPQLARLVGTPGPSIKLQTLDGHTIDLANVYGQKPIYLKLWATYCLPCRAQMPEFEKTYDRFRDRMQIVSVNAGVGDDADKVRAFVTKSGSHIPVAIDDGSLGAWLKMEATPFHVLIGRDGRIAYAGHQDGPKLDAAIAKVLDSPAPGTGASINTAKVESVSVLKPGDRIPAIDLRRPDDSPLRFDGTATAKPRAVLFMSVWCESYLKQSEPESVEACRRVREQVDTLSQAGTVDWLGVATHLWTTPEDLAKYQTKMKTRVPLGVDSDGLAFRVFGIRRLPAVALIGANGRLVRVLGPDDTDLAAAVEKLAPPK
jgi:peroxiredoxin